MAAGQQFGRGGRRKTRADFSGQRLEGLQPGCHETHEKARSRGVQASVAGPVLRLFHRATAAVIATLILINGRLRINRTVQEFEAGQGFQLTMRGGGQPEEGCQGKIDVPETPHAIIDA